MLPTFHDWTLTMLQPEESQWLVFRPSQASGWRAFRAIISPERDLDHLFPRSRVSSWICSSRADRSASDSLSKRVNS